MNDFSDKRRSGVLLHIASLPSPYGIGSLGKEAFDFADYLKEAGCSIWQILPLCVTSYGNSPYQSPSANGLNYDFLSLDELKAQGLLTEAEIQMATKREEEERIDFGYLFQHRLALLEKAFSRFDRTRRDFQDFVKEGKYHDFSFFMTLKKIHDFRPWYEWEEAYVPYRKEVEEHVLSRYLDIYLFFQWTQFEFLREFSALKEHLRQIGLLLMGDLPLYLSYDSLECYKYPELFLLDRKGRPTVVAGCPPDYFSPKGQLWGNPIYDWEYLKKNGYAFFDKRLFYALEFFDIVRLDHFRGFSAYYTIPYGREDAVIGKWVKGPGKDFFLDKKELPIVAEDLGLLDQDVYDLLDFTGYPGMKVVEFGMDGNLENDHFPLNIPKKCFAYTGTHDNMPLMGYLEELDEEGLENYGKSLKALYPEVEVDLEDYKKMSLLTMNALFESQAETVILPLQDLLFQGADKRMNTPSLLSENNWTYRTKKADFSKELQQRIKMLRKAGKRD